MEIRANAKSTLQDLNSTMTRTGSALWAAPELLSGKRYNEDVDTYSFGVVLYEIAVRELPFEEELRILSESGAKGIKGKIMRSIADGTRRIKIGGKRGQKRLRVGRSFRKRESVVSLLSFDSVESVCKLKHLLAQYFATAACTSLECVPRWRRL